MRKLAKNMFDSASKKTALLSAAPLSRQRNSNAGSTGFRYINRRLAHLALYFLAASAAWSQTPDAGLIQKLMQRLDQQESRIQALEAALAAKTADLATQPSNPAAAIASATATSPTLPAQAVPVTNPVSRPEQATAAEAPQEPAVMSQDAHDHMVDIPGGPTLKFRGYFDFNLDTGSVAQNLLYPLNAPPKTSFRAGEFDLFLSSQINDKLSFISEIVFGSDATNEFGIDIERYQLTYKPSKYFQISGGRYHTSIGYYNTAYHHGLWFSTATGRPFMYYFEDSGGPLPVHNVGVTTTGEIPSGKLDLHWVAEIGNGRASRTDVQPVQNFLSDRNHKDVNFAVYARPESVSGLQVGASFLTGQLSSPGTPKIGQQIISAHAVYIFSKWEWLNEGVLRRDHYFDSGRTYNAPMAYTQLAYKIGKYKPYFRVQDVNIANNDAATGFTGTYFGPSFGLRIDTFDFAALKFQYNRVYPRFGAPQNGAEAQVAFTF